MSAKPTRPHPIAAPSPAQALLAARERIVELEAELGVLRAALVRIESMRAEDRLALEEAQAVREWRDNQIVEMEAQVDAAVAALERERSAGAEQLDAVRDQLHEAAAEAVRARRVVESLSGSLSWRLTAPMRAMLGGVRRLRGGRAARPLPPGED